MTTKADQACTETHGRCASLPELVRMNYFHGQLISERDLRTEQDYFRAKLRHANRCLHGYGVLCGLEVRPLPPSEDCPPDSDGRRDKLDREIAELDRRLGEMKQNRDSATADDIDRLVAEIESLRRERDALPPGEKRRVEHYVELACGAAIDCDGNDIIVRHPVKVDLDDLLEKDCDGGQSGSHGDGPYGRKDDDAYGRKGGDEAGHEGGHESGHEEGQEGGYGGGQDGGGGDGGRFVYLSLCYHECGREPTRPFELDQCATSVRCHDARTVEAWRLTASYRRPSDDERCDLCCESCGDACLLLARIRLDPGRPIRPQDIDHNVRRRFGLYDPTVVTGINWRHAFTYSLAAADGLLGTDNQTGGLEIRFSRPVRASTLERGVVDVWRIEGGKGGRGEAKNMEAHLLVPATGNGLVDRFHINNSSRERVQRGDRILVIVRTAFILDSCCRPVDGAHLGGRLPRLPSDDAATEGAREEESQLPLPEECAHPPQGPVPWTTGAGGNFESWFYVSEA